MLVKTGGLLVKTGGRAVRRAVLVVIAGILSLVLLAGGGAGADTTGGTWTLVSTDCHALGAGWVQAGRACWDQPAGDRSDWQVRENSATWSAPGASASFTYAMPGQIAGGGASGSYSVTVSGRTSPGPGSYSGEVCVQALGTFQLKAGGQCANASSNQSSVHSQSQTLTLTSLRDAPAGTKRVAVEVNLQGNVELQSGVKQYPGGKLYFTYEEGTGGSTPSSASISGINGKVEVQLEGGGWVPADRSQQLKAGDRIHTGYNGSLTVTLPDGSTMVVGRMSLVVIEQIGGTTQARVLVSRDDGGKLRAEVHAKAGIPSDFKVGTPTTTASIRGSIMDVFYDPIARLTIVAAVADKATVKPTRRGAKSIVVPQGKEVEVTRSGVSRLAPIGKAGARGGIDARVALDRVLDVIARHLASCELTAPRIAPGVKPRGPSAWTVSVPVRGKTSGTSIWTVAGKRVTPFNAVAKTIASGCS